MNHLAQLQKIADANGDNRASGTPGYNASLRYIEKALRDVGVRGDPPGLHVQCLPGLDWRPRCSSRSRPNPEVCTTEGTKTISWLSTRPAATWPSSEAVDVIMPQGAPGSTSKSGCDEADFAGSPPGISRWCSAAPGFLSRRPTPDAAGRRRRDHLQRGPARGVRPLLHARRRLDDPCFGTSFEIGDDLAVAVWGSEPVVIHLSTADQDRAEKSDPEPDRRDADRRDRPPWWMAGAHLDSVPEGPGINDTAPARRRSSRSRCRWPTRHRAA